MIDCVLTEPVEDGGPGVTTPPWGGGATIGPCADDWLGTIAYDDEPSPVLPHESCCVYDSIGYGAAAIRVCLARALPDRPLDDDIVPTGRIRDGGGSDAVIFHDAALNHSSDFLRSERYLG